MWPDWCSRMSKAFSIWVKRAVGRRTLWLQVAVDEAHQMQILERSCDLGGVKARCILVYALIRSGLEGSEELAATAVLHAEVEMIF